MEFCHIQTSRQASSTVWFLWSNLTWVLGPGGSGACKNVYALWCLVSVFLMFCWPMQVPLFNDLRYSQVTIPKWMDFSPFNKGSMCIIDGLSGRILAPLPPWETGWDHQAPSTYYAWSEALPVHCLSLLHWYLLCFQVHKYIYEIDPHVWLFCLCL